MAFENMVSETCLYVPVHGFPVLGVVVGTQLFLEVPS